MASMSDLPTICSVAVPTRLWQRFDYLIPEQIHPADCQPGMRVKVPFGRREMVGVILQKKAATDFQKRPLKPLLALLDQQPIIPAAVLKLQQWVSDYYHYPIGEVVVGTMPKPLRQGEPALLDVPMVYQLTAAGVDAAATGVKRAPKLTQLLQFLAQQGFADANQCRAAGFGSQCVLNAIKKKMVTQTEKTITQVAVNHQIPAGLVLNTHQQAAVTQITQQKNYQTFLLAGVTGSGKTEVYLQSIAPLVQAGKQVLILVPEIGLTPQTIGRFRDRFNVTVVVLHSGLTDRERRIAWVQALQGDAKIIIGTRSAVFVPMREPGMIIIDEEHDTSFKQQSGFRYSARDCAVMRGVFENVPVVLGTATPSLETLHNVQRGKYQCLSLPERAGRAQMPALKIVDLRDQPLVAGLSIPLLQAMRAHLEKGHQVLLFLNRRGYAPTLICHHCSWTVACDQCDARMTLHLKPRRLCCHHCGRSKAPPRVCPACQQAELIPLGLGTERLEEVLQEQFPHYRILRVDRDTVRGKYDMQKVLQQVHDNSAQILIGTQMLAKGHHFPSLTLVAVIEADGALFSADFRALEHMAQLLMQVAGRAGREQHRGEVILQTHAPEHPFLNLLIEHGYEKFTEAVLAERAATGLPPYSHLAILRAEGLHEMLPNQFLENVKQQFHEQTQVRVLGPVPTLMARKAGYYRAQLLLQTQDRSALQRLLQPIVPTLNKSRLAKKVQWTLDIDPLEVL